MERVRPSPCRGGAITDTPAGASPIAAPHRARVPPLLLTGAALVVAPTLTVAGWPPVATGATITLAVAGVAIDRFWPRIPRPRQQLLSVGSVLTATVVYLTLLATIGAQEPVGFLPFGAALICAMSAVRRSTIRVLCQSAAGLGATATLLASGRALDETLLVVLLLVAVGGLANLLTGSLIDARVRERRARRDAERRSALLAAVRELPGQQPDSAIRAVVRALRTLGFDASGVALLEYGELRTVDLDGLPVLRPLRPGEGLAGRSLAEDRTTVVERYRDHPDALLERPTVGSAVVAPIRVDEVPTGTVTAVRHHEGPFSSTEVEVVEVLAAHLGGVLASDRSVNRQRELLRRMSELEAMRAGFVAEVSDGLRDPLTVVRGVGQTIATHGEMIPSPRREQLLSRMHSQTAELERTVVELLDFSRFQADHHEPAWRSVATRALLADVAVETGARLGRASTTLVEIDRPMVAHALALLVRQFEQVVLTARDHGDEVVVGFGTDVAGRAGLLRSLAAQLLVAGGARLATEGRQGNRVTVHLPIATMQQP